MSFSAAFADEAANQKTAVQQFAALAALGLQYYSIRFIDAGGGIKNVMKLTLKEIQHIRHLEDEYGLNVASIGSPIGKVKLRGRRGRHQERLTCRSKSIWKGCQESLRARPCLRDEADPRLFVLSAQAPTRSEHLPQAVDQLGQIAETCHRSDLTFGLEIEANLVGQTGQLLAEIHRKVNHPAMVLIFDAANILCQGYNTVEVYEQYLAMKPAIGWMHIKDYLPSSDRPSGKGTSTKTPSRTSCRSNWGTVRMNGFCATSARRFPSSRSSCVAAASPACFWTWSRTSKGAGNSAASAGRTAWAWPCEASAACSISPTSTITSAISTIFAQRGDSKPRGRFCGQRLLSAARSARICPNGSRRVAACCDGPGAPRRRTLPIRRPRLPPGTSRLDHSVVRITPPGCVCTTCNSAAWRWRRNRRIAREGHDLDLGLADHFVVVVIIGGRFAP